MVRGGEGAAADPDVIISYRRDDAEQEAALIRKRLEQEIGQGRVFRDLYDKNTWQVHKTDIEDVLDKSRLLISDNQVFTDIDSIPLGVNFKKLHR